MTESDEPTRRDRRDEGSSDEPELPTPPVESPGEYYEFGEDPPEGVIIYPSEGGGCSAT